MHTYRGHHLPTPSAARTARAYLRQLPRSLGTSTRTPCRRQTGCRPLRADDYAALPHVVVNSSENLVDKPASLDAHFNHRRGAPGEKSRGRFFVSGARRERHLHPHISRANQRMRPMMRISSAVRS